VAHFRWRSRVSVGGDYQALRGQSDSHRALRVEVKCEVKVSVGGDYQALRGRSDSHRALETTHHIRSLRVADRRTACSLADFQFLHPVSEVAIRPFAGDQIVIGR